MVFKRNLVGVIHVPNVCAFYQPFFGTKKTRRDTRIHMPNICFFPSSINHISFCHEAIGLVAYKTKKIISLNSYLKKFAMPRPTDERDRIYYIYSEDRIICHVDKSEEEINV